MCRQSIRRYTEASRARAGYAAPMGQAVMSSAEAADAAGEEAALAARIAAAAGSPDAAAEAAFYRLMAPRVRRYGLRHLRDAHAAGDLMQLVMLRTMEQLREGRVREPQRIVSFVFGMCRMVLMAQRRGESRRGELLERFGHVLVAEPPPPEPRLDHRRVADCLERLAERERSVIVLSFYDERGADDVASMLGTTPGNVRVIRHRGLARLRDCVAGAPR